RHIAEALERTDAVTAAYIDKHRKHFSHHFAQTLCFLGLYALASATLLGLGGWLVIQGQLTLGQLVAAELVMSVVFFGLSQLGTYLSDFYALCAALDELSLFYSVEQEEEPAQQLERIEGDSELTFAKARGDARGNPTTLNFSIPNNARVLGVPETHGVQRELTNFLKRHIQPASGYVSVGGHDIMGIKAHQLRQDIIVLDRPNAIEMTIREYLTLSGAPGMQPRLLEILEVVGLEPTIAQLDRGLDTRIASTGWPLTITETMQLKLAASIIADPKVIVLGKLYDTMPDTHLQRSFDVLQEDRETTILYFTSRPRDLGFSHYLYLGHSRQSLYPRLDDLIQVVESEDIFHVSAPQSQPTPGG
ncbi:MAG: ATP-binding cassette domain-containing protein, partial [Algiphilus sp.]